MPDTQVFSFSSNVVTINGTRITGFADGDDVVKVTPAADLVAVNVGADGTTVYSVSGNKGWDVEISLLATAPINGFFRNIAHLIQMPAFLPPALQLGIVDMARRDRYSGTGGIITKVAEKTFGETVATLVWTMHFSDGEFVDNSVASYGAV